MKHLLYSQDLELNIAYFEKFDKEAIKREIIKHLKDNPTDTLEHCKEFSKQDIRKHYGNEILNFYECNPKTKEPSKVIIKDDKQYYKTLQN